MRGSLYLVNVGGSKSRILLRNVDETFFGVIHDMTYHLSTYGYFIDIHKHWNSPIDQMRAQTSVIAQTATTIGWQGLFTNLQEAEHAPMIVSGYQTFEASSIDCNCFINNISNLCFNYYRKLQQTMVTTKGPTPLVFTEI